VNQTEKFNLDRQIKLWIEKLKTGQSVTDTDAEELKSHLLDTIDDLVGNSGLDEEEAFIIATRRLGTTSEWENEYRQENTNILQVRRTAVILAGILLYFFFFHLIESGSKGVFLLLSKTDIWMALEWTTRLLMAVHFVFILLLISILLYERMVISYIENIRIKVKHTIWLLAVTFLLGIINTSMNPLVKNMLKGNNYVHDYIILYRNFEFTFPLMICIGFVFIYARYHKKAKF
jgi:hypothetical protein